MSGSVPPLPVLTKFFESAEQTITSAGGLTIAHGLSVRPLLIQVSLVNKTAEYGYSIGDVVPFNPHGNDLTGPAERGLTVVPDATNIVVRFGANAAAFAGFNKTTGAAVSITNANWKVIFRVWA